MFHSKIRLMRKLLIFVETSDLSETHGALGGPPAVRAAGPENTAIHCTGSHPDTKRYFYKVISVC